MISLIVEDGYDQLDKLKQISIPLLDIVWLLSNNDLWSAGNS